MSGLFFVKYGIICRMHLTFRLMTIHNDRAGAHTEFFIWWRRRGGFVVGLCVINVLFYTLFHKNIISITVT